VPESKFSHEEANIIAANTFNQAELDRIADVVLVYKPKPKTKAAKRRIRRNKRKAKQLEDIERI
jgi:histidinol dehydrogenase